MKMVKSLLLGTAAGLVATAGAQAADLPVKAKPVEYVKVCSLYGAGFFFIPGTDICLKVGGFVRNQHYWGQGISPGVATAFEGTAGQQSRLFNASNDYVMRTRAVMTLDSRQQTEYGTLRTYFLFGFTHENGSGAVGQSLGANAPALYATRGFIQLAGFTLGKAVSFYDFYNSAAYSYLVQPTSSTGDGGINIAAYTAQLGNGVSASISLEDPRRLVVANTSIANSFTVGNNPTSDTGNIRWPDVVGALRIDQAWGSAQIAAAAHDASGGYYGTTLSGSAINGHPDNEVGWAVGGGALFKLDFLNPGDHFSFQANYAQGANKYVNNTSPGGGSPGFFSSGNSVGVGWFTDGVFGGSLANGTASDVELTTAWGVGAGYDHKWNPKWQTSVYGGFVEYLHNGKAKELICANPSGGANTISTGLGTGTLGGPGCDPDFQIWWVGTRTQFNVTSAFNLGLEVFYQRIETGLEGSAFYNQATGLPRPTGPYLLEHQDNVTVTFRAHRDIVP